MKPFLGIDLTTDKKNETFNGEHFLVAQPSSVMTQALENSSEEAEETIDRSKLPLPIRIGQWVCGAVGAVIAIGIAKALGGEDSVSLGEAYQNAPWMFWLAGGCLVVWLILNLWSAQKAKTVLSSDENTAVFSKLDGVCDAIYAELSVPADAKEVDILSFYYKVKGNDIKVCEKTLQLAPYMNPEFSIFADSENLYLANLEGKYAFPLSCIQSIRTVKKNIRIPGWNKDEDLNKGVYKQYHLATDKFDCVHCKTYHILELTCGGESWGIYFPCYELPAFEEVTGIRAQ